MDKIRKIIFLILLLLPVTIFAQYSEKQDTAKCSTVLLDNIKPMDEGSRRTELGGILTIIGSLSLTTGFALSYITPKTDQDIINGLIIGGSVTIGVGGGFMISGANFNRNKKNGSCVYG